MPGVKQAWPNSAACWSPAIPVTGSLTPPSRTPRRSRRRRQESTISGRQARGTPKQLEQPVVPVAGAQMQSSVRLALVTSVTCADAPVSLIQQPAVDRAECELAALRARRARRARGRAARRAWCRRNTDRAAARCAPRSPASWPAARSSLTGVGGAAVLPDDGAVQPVRRLRGPTAPWFHAGW